MKMLLNPLLHKFRLIQSDLLVVNALYLFGVLFSSSLLGSVIWILVARLYTPESVGVAASTISVTQLLSGVASLGMGMGIVRFLPIAYNANEMVDSVITVTIISSTLISILFSIGMPVWAPSLATHVNGNWTVVLLVVMLVIANSIYSLLQMIFQATRTSKYAFWHALLANIFRLALTIVFVSIGTRGIILATLIPMIFISGVSGLLFVPKSLPGYHFHFTFPKHLIYQLVPYAIGVYIAGQVSQTPILLSPLLVLEKLGPQVSASAYMGLMIGSFIVSPGQAIAASAFAEGSNVLEDLNRIINRANKLSLVITIGSAIFVLIAAPLILAILGKEYQMDTRNLIFWFALSSPLVAINKNGFTVMQIHKNINKLIGVSVLSFVVFFVVSYLAISSWKLNSIGFAWLIAQIVMFLGCLTEVFPQFGKPRRT